MLQLVFYVNVLIKIINLFIYTILNIDLEVGDALSVVLKEIVEKITGTGRVEFHYLMMN